MNNFEKAVFVDFVMRDIAKITPQIASAMFLKFGYHTNYALQPPDNEVAGYDLAPNVDDAGAQARQIAINTVVPNIMQGLYPANNALFSLNLSADDGYPCGVREHSVQGMTNPQPHVFELDFYESNRDGNQIQKNKKERLKIVFYDKNGAPVTLAAMLAATTLIPPTAPAVIKI